MHMRAWGKAGGGEGELGSTQVIMKRESSVSFRVGRRERWSMSKGRHCGAV